MISNDFETNKAILELQGKLNLKKDFFKKLLEEDDWSFIIKLHALIEAACTHLLLHRFNEPSLKKIISRLELSNKTFGKIAFIKELYILGDNSRRYISSLSELRNNFVHNVQNCNASLIEIVEKMDKNQFKKFALDFSTLESTESKDIDMNILINNAKKNPKFHIWFGGYTLLNSLLNKYNYKNTLNLIKQCI